MSVLSSSSAQKHDQSHFWAIHKVPHARGEGEGSEMARQFVTEHVTSRACDVTLLKFVIIHMKPEIQSNVYLSVMTDAF